MNNKENIKVDNKKSISKYSFGRLLITELRDSLSIGKILGLIVGGLLLPLLINYIPLFIGGARTSTTLFLTASMAVTIFIFSRVTTSVQQKSTVDKNKAAFLYYKKTYVSFTKLISEAILFSIGFFLLFGIAFMVGKYHPKSENIDFNNLSSAMMKSYPGLLAMHLFVFSISKWLISFIPKKSLAYAAAIFTALVLTAPVFILSQLPQTTMTAIAINPGFGDGRELSSNEWSIIAKEKYNAADSISYYDIIRKISAMSSQQRTNWFSQNQTAAAFTPLYNFGFVNAFTTVNTINFIPNSDFDKHLEFLNLWLSSPTSSSITPVIENHITEVLKVFNNLPKKTPQMEHEWYAIIPIAYSIIFLGASWKLQSGAQKRYLAAS